jgi:hypothetical protein
MSWANYNYILSKCISRHDVWLLLERTEKGSDSLSIDYSERITDKRA